MSPRWRTSGVICSCRPRSCCTAVESRSDLNARNEGSSIWWHPKLNSALTPIPCEFPGCPSPLARPCSDPLPTAPRMTAGGWNNWALRRSRLSADQVSEMECSGTQRATNCTGGGRRDLIPWRLQAWRQAMAEGKLEGIGRGGLATLTLRRRAPRWQLPASYHDCNLTSGVLSAPRSCGETSGTPNTPEDGADFLLRPVERDAARQTMLCNLLGTPAWRGCSEAGFGATSAGVDSLQ